MITEAIASWTAFSPEELSEAISAVTRSDPNLGRSVVSEMANFARMGRSQNFTFSTERRDPFNGALIGGATWLATREDLAVWKLHLLQSEPEGVA